MKETSTKHTISGSMNQLFVPRFLFFFVRFLFYMLPDVCSIKNQLFCNITIIVNVRWVFGCVLMKHDKKMSVNLFVVSCEYHSEVIGNSAIQNTNTYNFVFNQTPRNTNTNNNKEKSKLNNNWWIRNVIIML